MVEWKKYKIEKDADGDISIYKEGRGQDEGYWVHIASIPSKVLKGVIEDK